MDYRLIAKAARAAADYTGVVEIVVAAMCDRVELYIRSISSEQLRSIGSVRI